MYFSITLILLCKYTEVSTASPLFLRYKRDFVPPGFGSAPQQGAPAPSNPLQPEHVDPSNPFLESLSDPIYPNYGLGVGFQRPVIVGGAANFPTGNVFNPTENVNGTFGFTRLRNVRFGTQGGPFFPWQDPKYGSSAKQLAMLQYRQQQQQDQLAQQASQQALARQSANNAPNNPFPGANSNGPPPGIQQQRLRQLPALGLATPPPLPAQFRST